MKNKKIIGIIVLIILVLILGLIVWLKLVNKEGKEEFILDTDNKYLLRTSEHFTTMQNDGGSHIDRYYQIDLDKRKVELLEDNYKGFEGYKYQGRILYSKTVSSDEANSLKQILNKMIENKDLINEKELEFSERYDYFTLSTKQYKDIKVYDKQLINDFLGILEINNEGVCFMNFEQACEIAYKYIEENWSNRKGIKSIFDLSEYWFFTAKSLDNKIIIDNSGSFIMNKKTAEIRNFYFTNKEDVALLKNKIEKEVPEKYKK